MRIGETVVLVLKSFFLPRHEGLIRMWKADASPGSPSSCRGGPPAGPGLWLHLDTCTWYFMDSLVKGYLTLQ